MSAWLKPMMNTLSWQTVRGRHPRQPHGLERQAREHALCPMQSFAYGVALGSSSDRSCSEPDPRQQLHWQHPFSERLIVEADGFNHSSTSDCKLTVVDTVRREPSGLQATLKTACPMGSSTDSAWISLISAPVRSSTLALLPPPTTAAAQADSLQDVLRRSQA